MTGARRITTSGVALGALAALGAGCGSTEHEGFDGRVSRAALLTPAGEHSTLDLRPGLATDLAVAPIAPARAAPAGGVVLPIAGGSVAPGSIAGRIEHRGGLRLRRRGGGPAVVIRHIVIDTRADVVRGRVGGHTLPLVRLRPQEVRSKPPDAGTIRTWGIHASVTPQLARLLNHRAGTRAVHAGERAGTVAIRLALRSHEAKRVTGRLVPSTRGQSSG